MKSTFTIACRGSWLSLAQVQLFIKKVKSIYADVQLEIKIVETAGDKEQLLPLHLVEGKDFFTKEIQQTLQNNQADFAIHSMKDVSSLDFFNEGHYAVFDRDLMHDVAIFNPSVLQKIKNGQPVIIGTSSPRRSSMASAFLQKALPQLNGQTVKVQAAVIRGNVDTRLQKLTDGLYDGIILAAAGLNRLLQYAPAKDKIEYLLHNKINMLLPLFECAPAAGQGAVVAETQSSNADAITILQQINNVALTDAIKKERVYAQKYGYGCSQQFGVFHLQHPLVPFTYAAGHTAAAGAFTEWDFEVDIAVENKKIVSAADYMKSFFEYEYKNDISIDAAATTVFISSYKVVHSDEIKKQLVDKKVWAAGTKTWYHLANTGIWVNGCADGLGFDFLQPLFYSPLINIAMENVQLLTNSSSMGHWQNDGIKAAATYSLTKKITQEVKDEIAAADIIFWTSYQQYEQCKALLKAGVLHSCPSGKTAVLLQAAGINPVVFPTIKSFNYWRKKISNTGF